MSDRIYVCEWVKKDFSFMENEEEFCLLQSFDYTYHDNLEQAQNIASLNYKGYALAKGHIDDINSVIDEKPLHKKIHCECIWIYEDNYAFGRYVRQNGKWIYDAYCENWEYNWAEMLTIPTPLID